MRRKTFKQNDVAIFSSGTYFIQDCKGQINILKREINKLKQMMAKYRLKQSKMGKINVTNQFKKVDNILDYLSKNCKKGRNSGQIEELENIVNKLEKEWGMISEGKVYVSERETQPQKQEIVIQISKGKVEVSKEKGKQQQKVKKDPKFHKCQEKVRLVEKDLAELGRALDTYEGWTFKRKGKITKSPKNPKMVKTQKLLIERKITSISKQISDIRSNCKDFDEKRIENISSIYDQKKALWKSFNIQESTSSYESPQSPSEQEVSRKEVEVKVDKRFSACNTEYNDIKRDIIALDRLLNDYKKGKVKEVKVDKQISKIDKKLLSHRKSCSTITERSKLDELIAEFQQKKYDFQFIKESQREAIRKNDLMFLGLN